MTTQNFTTSFEVAQTPADVYDAVRDVRGWWLQSAEGEFEKEGDEFTVRFGDVHYSRQRLLDVVPGKRVSWLVTESRLNFIARPDEWTGSIIRFEVLPSGTGSELRFTHEGLAPEIECYDACSGAWSGYIQGSLRSLITTGKGKPAL